jgi:hypothetical protein
VCRIGRLHAPERILKIIDGTAEARPELNLARDGAFDGIAS